MRSKDILVTGLGVISAAGLGLSEHFHSFTSLKRNAREATLFKTPLKYPVFEIEKSPAGFDPEINRTLNLALYAVREALEDAKLSEDLSGFRVGICLGTTVASQLNDLVFYKNYRDNGFAPMKAIDKYLKGNISEFIGRKLKANGPSFTVVNACSSGADAIGAALSWLRAGICDIAIAGGADELNRIPLCGFNSLGILNPGLCAPFDKDRKGLNLGEGAGILILETQDSAKGRGKFSDLFLTGYGSCNDAYHLTAPRPDGMGLKKAIETALKNAGIIPHDVGFINAHGTGTIENDKIEGMILGEMFGNNSKILSSKGFTGHTLGAAGGMEAVFTVAGLSAGWIPPSIGFQNADGNIPVTPVIEKTYINSNYALSTSLAFGGNNAALVFGRKG